MTEQELRRILKTVEGLTSSTRHLSIGVARLEERASRFHSEWERASEDLARLRDRIDLLAKKVLEGDGAEDSIVVQVRLLAETVGHLEGILEAKEEEHSALTKVDIQGKWKLAEKAVTALIAAISAAIMFVLQQWWTK
jgi:uncharacterized coiled-coil DUF342 family protein